MLSALISIFYLAIRYCFLKLPKNIVRFSHENERMHPAFKENGSIFNIVNSQNAVCIDFFLFKPMCHGIKEYKGRLSFNFHITHASLHYIKNILHSAFSTLRIFYTPHFLHSPFSTLRRIHRTKLSGIKQFRSVKLPLVHL